MNISHDIRSSSVLFFCFPERFSLQRSYFSEIHFLRSNLVISKETLVYNFLTKLRLRNSLMEYEQVAGKNFYG